MLCMCSAASDTRRWTSMYAAHESHKGSRRRRDSVKETVCTNECEKLEWEQQVRISKFVADPSLFKRWWLCSSTRKTDSEANDTIYILKSQLLVVKYKKSTWFLNRISITQRTAQNLNMAEKTSAGNGSTWKTSQVRRKEFDALARWFFRYIHIEVKG